MRSFFAFWLGGGGSVPAAVPVQSHNLYRAPGAAGAGDLYRALGVAGATKVFRQPEPTWDQLTATWDSNPGTFDRPATRPSLYRRSS